MAFATPTAVSTGASTMAQLPARLLTGRARSLLRWAPLVLLVGGAICFAAPWKNHATRDAALAPTSALPLLGAPVSDASSLVGALLVVGGLLVALPAVVRRLAPVVQGGRAIEVMESRALGGRRSLLIVRIEGRRLLLGASESGLALLTTLDPPGDRFAATLRSELAPTGEERPG